MLTHALQLLEQSKSIQLRKHNIHNKELRMHLLHKAQRFHSGAGTSQHLKIPRGFHGLFQHHPILFACVC